MSHVELGYFVNPEYDRRTDLKLAVAEQQKTVRLCHELGISAVVCGEHYSRGPNVWLPPLMLLSQLYEHGPGLLFGTGVLVLPLHHPVRLAEQVAFLDQVTDGRFALGLSAGWNRAEFSALNVPMAGRTRKLEEGIEILRLLWTADKPVSYSGQQYQVQSVELVLKPKQPGGVPIWIGASSDAALQRAALLGDAWIASSHLPNDKVEEQATRYAQMRHDGGLPMPSRRPGLRNIYVAETREQAIADAGPHLISSYGALNNSGLFSEVLKEGSDAVDYARAAGRAIVGDPESVAEELIDFLRASKVNLLLARIQWLGMPDDKVRRCLEILSTDVMPTVNKALQSIRDLSERAKG